MSRLLITILTTITLLLSACGWHLRGDGINAAGIDKVSISARDSRSNFITTLKRTLAAHHIETVSEANATYQIAILNQRNQRRSVAVSGAGRTAEYLLTSQITFVIQSDNGAVNQPITLSAERYFDFDENRVLASQQEQQELQRAINKNLARQIVNHLQNVAQKQPGPANATQS